MSTNSSKDDIHKFVDRLPEDAILPVYHIVKDIVHRHDSLVVSESVNCDRVKRIKHLEGKIVEYKETIQELTD